MSMRVVVTVGEIGARVEEHYGHGLAVPFGSRGKHPEPTPVANLDETPVPAGSVCLVGPVGAHEVIVRVFPRRPVV